MKKNNQLMRGGSQAPISIYKSDALESIDRSINQLQSVIDGVVKDIDPSQIKCETVSDIYKLSNALSALSRAKTEKERLTVEASGMLDVASKELYREIQKIMKFNPKLSDELAEVVKEARTNVKLLAD